MDSMTPSVEAQEQHGSDAEGNTRSALAVRALTNDTNPIRISSMVDLRDVCRLRLLCRATKEDYGRRARKACLTRGAGVPEDRRIQFWQFMLNVEKEMAEKSAGEQKRSASDLYKSCLHGATRGQVTDSPEKGDPKSGSSAFNAAHTDGVTSLPSGRRALSNSGAEGEISRDVGRTFPQLSMFNDPNGPGQNMLANVLRACLNSNPDIGYCQGMNFVAGALLLAYTVRDPSITSLPRKPRANPPGFESGVHDPASRGERTSRSELGETESSGHGSEREDVDDDGIDNDDYDDDEVVVLLRGAGHEGVVVDNEGDGDGEDDAPREWRSGPQHEKAEEDVFWMMLALSTRLPDVGAGLGMRELWLPGVPQLKVRVFQFDKLLLQELPRLYNHFKAKQLQLEVLVSQWFLTLFSYSLRPPLLMRVLDLTFMDGWKAMFRFGLARLRSVEATLCELEIEGVSRFLRGYREEDAPPSPLLRSMLQDAGDTSIPCGGGIRQASSESAASAAVGVGSSSQQVLRAAWKIKVTRKTLDRLQQDFAVQLLREHLEGQGQWLTRYGDAPEPNPGAGAGVVGGGADGDVGFMGVEAMTRMMLSDSKLLARLKEELDGMAAPVQSDAQIFQTKITEASERQEEATRERSTLAAELFRLKEDIEALGERKKLITEQMHQLLVEFEKDSARMKIEEARKRERARRASALGAEEVAAGDEGRGRTRGMKPEKDAGGHGDGGPRLISVETRMTQKTLPNSPAPEESPAGSEAVQERTAGRKACTDSPSHSKTSSNDDCSDGVESDDELPRSMSGPVSSPVSPSRSSSPASPPLRINPDGMLRMWKPVEGSPPAETSTSWRTGSPIFRPRFPRLSSFTSIPSVLPRDEADEEEDGGREGFVFLRRQKQGGEEGVARDGKGAGPFQDDARGVERSTTPQGAVELGGESFLTQMGAEGAWEKLAKWARPTSTWFKSGALRRSRVLGGSLSPPRGSSRGENQGELTPMEELYEDLKKFRRKLEEVQASIDAKTDTYAALQNRYSKAVVEAEEAMELKRALSSQMLHLLLEQERRVDGHLRDCISFTNASGSDGLSSDLLNYFSRAGLSSAGREGCSPADATAAGTTAVAATTEEEDSGRAAEHDGDDTKKRARTVTGKTFDENESIPAALVMSRDHSGDKERCNPREGPAAGTTEEEDVGEESETNDGFEKVEGWMAQDSVDDGCGPDDGDGDGDGDDGGDDGEKGTPDVRN